MSTAFSSLMPITQRPPIVFTRGEGAWLWDSEGNKYLDFIQGWAVNCLGHGHPALIEALTTQAQTLINCSPAFYNGPMLKLADLLRQEPPFGRPAPRQRHPLWFLLPGPLSRRALWGHVPARIQRAVSGQPRSLDSRRSPGQY